MNFEKYQSLFGIEWDGEDDRIKKGVSHYRIKVIDSGAMVELELYPVWDAQNQQRAKAHNPSRIEQERLNKENTRKKIVRLINRNFGRDDLFVTLTYAKRPPGPEQARRDVVNFLRRVKAWRDRNSLPPLKYLYVIEYGALDQMGVPKKIHTHMVLSGGMDRDELENLWKGGRANTRRLKPDDYGLEGLASYICKLPAGGRQWARSRNLIQPEVRYPKHRVSRQRAVRIATDRATAEDALKKQFPRLRLLDVKTKVSDYCAGAYLYARMRRDDFDANGGNLDARGRTDYQGLQCRPPSRPRKGGSCPRR